MIYILKKQSQMKKDWNYSWSIGELFINIGKKLLVPDSVIERNLRKDEKNIRGQKLLKKKIKEEEQASKKKCCSWFLVTILS